MESIKRLDWDSKFFGYEVGKVLISDFEDFDYSKFKKDSINFKLVYVFAQQRLNEYNKLKLVDEKVTFHREIPSTVTVNTRCDYSITSFIKEIHDINALRQLALESGIYSRFNVDNHFDNNEFKNLYLHWINNSVKGKLALDTIIVVDHNDILGFATLTEKTTKCADIGLVAVDQTSRGKGVGLNLICEAIKRARNLGYQFVQVVTQKANIPAVRLYEKAEFKIKDITYIYHYWNL